MLKEPVETFDNSRIFLDYYVIIQLITMSSVNFKQPLEDDSHFQDYLKSKEETIQKKDKAKRPQSTHMWALVFVLMVSLVGLGITALLQYQRSQTILAQFESSSVAGVSERTDVQNIITAEGFSIILDQPTPEGYELDRSSGPSEYLTELDSVTSSLLAQFDQDEANIISGIEVEVTEYDNALNKTEFADLVLSQLGEDYSKMAGEVEIPKNFSLTHLKNTSETTDGIDYYTAVTSNNYYVIKLYTQTSPFPEYITYTRFSDDLLSGLYLN